MTAQTPEEFVYKGKRYLGIYAEPLHQYLQTQNIEFQAFISTCWRGYRGYGLYQTINYILLVFQEQSEFMLLMTMCFHLIGLTKRKILALIICSQIGRMSLLNGFQGR